MTSENRLWFDAYQSVVKETGNEPDWTLMEYLPFISSDPVLDLAMGNGRNALFFAKMGFEVDCVDVSKTWVKKCRDYAKEENLKMRVYKARLQTVAIPPRRYSLIIASKILQLLRIVEIEAIAEQIYAGLAKRGILYVRTFSVEHVKRSEKIPQLEQVEPNTYYSPKHQQTYHYFTRDELPTLFPKLKVLYYIDGIEVDRTLKKPRYPWVIEYLGQRTH
ncbi:MAG: class I SAM-dependent methyltransferase [Promethearchaeota archaeon]